MAKRPSLAEKMRQVATDDTPPVNVMPETTVSPPPAPADERPARTSGYQASTRAGKKKVTAPLNPAAHKQFKQLGLNQDKKNEGLLIEAINDLFKKYGMQPIA